MEGQWAPENEWTRIIWGESVPGQGDIMMERGSLDSRSSEGVCEATCWDQAGQRMGAESGLEGPARKSLRDLD